MLIKTAIIRKTKKGYTLFSKSKDKEGKRRRMGGPYKTREEADERERQVQMFKHMSDDGSSDDAVTHTVSKLSDLAKYLEEAGMVEKADVLYSSMAALDSSLEDLTSDYQMNVENQGYIGGQGIGGGYSMFSTQAPVVAHIDMIKNLISVANTLDKLGEQDLADDLDDSIEECIKEISEESPHEHEEELDEGDIEEIMQMLEEMLEEDENIDALVRSNGLGESTVLETPGSAGLSDAYMYTGYSNLQGGA